MYYHALWHCPAGNQLRASHVGSIPYMFKDISYPGESRWLIEGVYPRNFAYSRIWLCENTISGRYWVRYSVEFLDGRFRVKHQYIYFVSEIRQLTKYFSKNVYFRGFSHHDQDHCPSAARWDFVVWLGMDQMIKMQAWDGGNSAAWGPLRVRGHRCGRQVYCSASEGRTSSQTGAEDCAQTGSRYPHSLDGFASLHKSKVLSVCVPVRCNVVLVS